jgi:hypothetical protein
VSVLGWGGNEGRAVPSDTPYVRALFTLINPLNALKVIISLVVVSLPSPRTGCLDGAD